MRSLQEKELAPGIFADVDDDGSGSWVFFFHSRFVNKALWTDIAAQIPFGSVCAFNQRGFNPGDAPKKTDPKLFLDDVADVFKVLAPRRAVLVGTSIGSGLALAACTDPRFPIVGAVLAGFLVPSVANSGVAQRFDQGSVLDRTFTSAAPPDAVKRFSHLVGSVPATAREFSVEDFWKYLSGFPYQSIRAPLLFVSGTDDTLMPPVQVRESLRRLPSARHVALDDVGHGVVSQSPEAFLGLLIDFLEEVGYGDPAQGR